MVELLLSYLKLLRSGQISYQKVLELSNLLWIYHRMAAKSNGLDTTKGGWFMAFVDKHEQVEYQRGAVDVVKDILQQNSQNKYELSPFYCRAIDNFISILTEFLHPKK